MVLPYFNLQIRQICSFYLFLLHSLMTTEEVLTPSFTSNITSIYRLEGFLFVGFLY